MIRSELRDDSCHVCKTRLSAADYLERRDVVYARGEYAGESGVVILAECSCGITSVIALAVNLRPAA